MGGLKSTRFISNKQATKFSAAIRFSKLLGRPLNQFVTLNLAHTSCAPGLVSLAVQDLVKNRFGRWLRYQEGKAVSAGQPSYGPPIYAWVIEAKDGFHHLHWCVHVDPRLREDFERRLPIWLTRSAGAIAKPIGAVDMKPVYGIGGLLKYCLKGLNHYHAGKRYVRVEDQGEVWGKRVGMSKSLGLAARRCASLLPRGRQGSSLTAALMSQVEGNKLVQWPAQELGEADRRRKLRCLLTT